METIKNSGCSRHVGFFLWVDDAEILEYEVLNTQERHLQEV